MNSINSDPQFKEALRVLKNQFNPQRLFLFGSRSNGTANEESDYDFLLVVSDENSDTTESIRKARRTLAEKNILADIFVYPETIFNERKREFGSMVESALNSGTEINLNE